MKAAIHCLVPLAHKEALAEIAEREGLAMSKVVEIAISRLVIRLANENPGIYDDLRDRLLSARAFR